MAFCVSDLDALSSSSSPKYTRRLRTLDRLHLRATRCADHYTTVIHGTDSLETAHYSGKTRSYAVDPTTLQLALRSQPKTTSTSQTRTSTSKIEDDLDKLLPLTKFGSLHQPQSRRATRRGSKRPPTRPHG